MEDLILQFPLVLAYIGREGWREDGGKDYGGIGVRGSCALVEHWVLLHLPWLDISSHGQ